MYGGHDPGVVCRSGLPINLWILGYPDQAVERSAEGLRLAREINHLPSVAFALIFDAMFHQHRRDVSRTRRSAEATIALTTTKELGWLPAWATALRGWAMVQEGAADEGIAALHEGIAGWTMMGLILRPYFLRLLAESYCRIGRVEQARAAVAEALAITEQTHEGFAEVELHRLNAELQPVPADAAACFGRAIEIARRQKAKLLELRATKSLCALLCKEGRHDEARERLAEVYSWFTEGFDTAELKEAAAFLK
jgi:adenylate cyclase